MRADDVASLPYETLVERGVGELGILTQSHDNLFGLSEAEWSVDLDAGTITFTNPEKGLEATAHVQVLGTYNTDDGTWLWSWENSSIPETCTADATRVREYGERHGYEELTTAKLEMDQEAVWDFVALAVALTGAQGAYCGPAGPTLVFLTYGTVKLSRLASD